MVDRFLILVGDILYEVVMESLKLFSLKEQKAILSIFKGLCILEARPQVTLRPAEVGVIHAERLTVVIELVEFISVSMEETVFK